MLGIVILNYNNAGLTIDCIESIKKYNSYPIKVVIVDNASNDDSVSVLNHYLHEGNSSIVLIRSEKNGGYAQGNNIGLKYFESIPEIRNVMILNNDILFTEDIIPKLVTFVDGHPDAGLVSPILRERDGCTVDKSCARRDCSLSEIVWSFCLYFTDVLGILTHYRSLSWLPVDQNQSSIEIELPSGSCMMINKGLFCSIGYFDPNTFLYFEENILYKKLLAVGKKNFLLPSLSCIHLGGETTNKVSHPVDYMKKTKWSAYYYAKNYLVGNLFDRILLEVSYGVFHIELYAARLLRYLKKKNAKSL